MYGARALAVPLKPGQQMKVGLTEERGRIRWSAKVLGNDWFQAVLTLPDLEILHTNDRPVARNLAKVLKVCARMKPDYFRGDLGYAIESRLEFDIRWGLGSSSSLVSNLAWWLDLDPFDLYRKLYSGSGYDVLTARAKKPVLFQLLHNKPDVREVDFYPPFRDSLFFVYLGEKSDSQESVGKFKTDAVFGGKEIAEVSEITDRMTFCTEIRDFIRLMAWHEEILSAILLRPPVGKSRFEDFPGGVKSLGAWGGDFVMVASGHPESVVRAYFQSKGLEVIFRYADLVL